MLNLHLEIDHHELRLYRDQVLILRGELDAAGSPHISPEPDGWRVEWPPEVDAEDAFDLHASGHWFGGQELLNQVWPIERAMLDARPLIT